MEKKMECFWSVFGEIAWSSLGVKTPCTWSSLGVKTPCTWSDFGVIGGENMEC